MRIEDRRPFNREGEPRVSSAPDQPSMGRDAWIGAGILALGVVVVVSVAILGAPDVQERDSRPTTQQAPSALGKLDAMVLCKHLVENRLKAPKTAEFPPDRYDRDVQKIRRGRFRYRSYVDSQNAFGAMLRTGFVCEVEDDGEGGANVLRLDFDE